ncbi:serine/threonine-protein kinase SBK1-like [Pseudophryne corroboree]|uniref:serine/threonine-protein kinase SBK1-like n=1 Tax=Pseudophryne corroboree TaxID=495146 RepID=UPI00308161DF
MGASVRDVELALEGLVSLASKGLQQIELKDIYHVMKELGVGGYASVFMVKDRKTDVRMALKVLDRKRTTERNFLMEFSISFLLSSHPNIIGSYGIAFKTQDHFAFAQELSPVGDLFSLILPHTGLPEDTVKRCAAQISSALEFIESKGMVHLDIKPENVLVFDQDCHCIKLTDFGLAHVKGKAIHARSGSASYMAPEMCQLADQDSLLVDSTLDVWAFGVVLYCLLTGEFPWQMALPRDKAYSRFAEWQTHTPTDNPPSPWDRLPTGVLRMFSHLLAIDFNQRSKSNEVLMFMDESWDSDRSCDNKVDAKDNCPAESDPSCVHQTSNSSKDESNTVTDASPSCESIPSATSSMSCHLYSCSSGSQCEEASDPRQKHALNPEMLMEDDVFLHVGAEVEIG